MKTKMKIKDWNNMKYKIINRKIVWKRSPFSRCQHPSPARLPGSYNRRLQAKYNFRKTTIISSTNRNREMYEVEDVKCSWKYMKALIIMLLDFFLDLIIESFFIIHSFWMLKSMAIYRKSFGVWRSVRKFAYNLLFWQSRPWSWMTIGKIWIWNKIHKTTYFFGVEFQKNGN